MVVLYEEVRLGWVRLRRAIPREDGDKVEVACRQGRRIKFWIRGRDGDIYHESCSVTRLFQESGLARSHAVRLWQLLQPTGRGRYQGQLCTPRVRTSSRRPSN